MGNNRSTESPFQRVFGNDGGISLGSVPFSLNKQISRVNSEDKLVFKDYVN